MRHFRKRTIEQFYTKRRQVGIGDEPVASLDYDLRSGEHVVAVESGTVILLTTDDAD